MGVAKLNSFDFELSYAANPRQGRTTESFFCFALFGEKFVNQSFRVSVSDTGFLKQYVVSNVKLSVKGLSRPPHKIQLHLLLAPSSGCNLK